MGEAAGVAAAMAVRENVASRDVPVDELQCVLERQGAVLTPAL
jgi:hypothetical protein